MNLIRQCVTAAAHPGPTPAASLRAFFQGYTWNLSSPSQTVLIKANLLELLLEGDDIIMTHKSVVNNPSPMSCHRRPCEVLHISEEGSHGLWASTLVNAPVASPTHSTALERNPTSCLSIGRGCAMSGGLNKFALCPESACTVGGSLRNCGIAQEEIRSVEESLRFL